MSLFKKVCMACMLALFVGSFAACGGGPGEVKITEEKDMNLPPAATGEMSPDDPDSGIDTQFQ